MATFPLLRNLLCWLALTLVVRANDPGGGAAGVGANVTLSTTSTTATLANGVVTAVIEKSTGKVTSYLFNGVQMLDTSGLIYYSFDGGASFDVPSGCVYSATTNTTDTVDISCKRTWNATAGYRHVLDIDVHWVLRRGDTGLYSYVVLNHPAAYPAAGFGEFRVVWKLPHDSTNFFFERAYVDALRNWQMESYFDFTHATATGIAEIIQLTSGVRAGKYDCKYEYAAEYETIGCWGHASNTNKKGVWMVMGGYDYLNDGPIHQDLTIAESYSLIHFGRDHFGGSSTSIAAGEAWKKVYGPHLLYCNSTTATTNAGDTLWADAKAQTTAEVAAWPYSWLVNADYPLAAQRGTVTGRFIVNDPLKPTVSAANAWVGVAAPEDTNGNWQYQGKGYQVWTRADASGNFAVPDVRPGSYTLYAFTDGAVGEYSQLAVNVTANATTALGNVTWNVTHPGTSIAWEIGTPNRSAREFKHGSDYFEPYLWNTFCAELPSPLEYTVGTSNAATDWNYAHSGHVDAGVWTPWKWRVHFNLAALPSSGNATLTLAFAGSDSARMDVYVNDEANLFARFYPPNGGGNGLIREGIHCKYGVSYVTIPVSALNVGANTITLIEGRTSGPTEHVMYDYLNLELPAFPPPPPTSGRSIVWKGGANAAADTWDIGATSSFLNGAAATAFGVGDAVTFDATGSNATNITLTGSLEPNAVTFTGTKNYTLAGNGGLIGQMSLVKSGTGKLTINSAQTFAGPTTITGGQIAFGNDAANTTGLGTSDVTLNGGTLTMYTANNNATGSTGSWNLYVPTGATGTLNADWRCTLTGELHGGGTFNFVLPSGGIRTDLHGDWSAFSGLINVTAASGSADFRMDRDYSFPGFPSAALNLGANVKAYWSGNLNSGGGSFMPIGELTGASSASLLGGSIGGRMLTYQIGERGTDFTFPGSIGEQSASMVTNIAKLGLGTWTMSGAATWAGNTTVEEGTLLLTGSLNSAGDVTVFDGALFKHTGAGACKVGSVQVIDGGTFDGSAAIAGDLNNDGTLLISAGTLSVAGNVMNNGTLRVTGGATLSAAGSFINNGVLDMLTGAPSLPAGLVNNGVVIDASSLRTVSVARAGTTVTLTAQTFTGHSYQLQRSPSLANPVWIDIGSPLAGNDAAQNFPDPAATGAQGFYRLVVVP